MRFGLPDTVLTYRDVARELTRRAGFTVSPATVWNFANDKPIRAVRMRKLFGLPVTVPVMACSCGEVHLRKGRCPNAPKPVLPAWVTAAADWLAAHEQVQATAKQRVYGRGGRRVTNHA